MDLFCFFTLKIVLLMARMCVRIVNNIILIGLINLFYLSIEFMEFSFPHFVFQVSGALSLYH